MSEDYRLNIYADQKSVADYLRTLADSLDAQGGDAFACLDDFRRIKLKIRNEFGQLHLKVKIDANKPCSTPEPAGDGRAEEPRPDYSTLKKRMRASFKVLVNMIHDGRVPPREAVDSFLEDSALMVTYPGYGDEFYGEYLRVCDEFRAAYDSGDTDRMHTAVDALVHEKSRCHAKYS